MRLKTRLENHGCDLSVDQVQDDLVELLVNMFPAWTVDELALHPKEALEFCEVARRQRQDYRNLPDDLVLRCLMARRKNPA